MIAVHLSQCVDSVAKHTIQKELSCNRDSSFCYYGKERKSIGYHAQQYWEAKSYLDCPNIKRIETALDKFRERARNTEPPSWYVKGACLYFTYNGDYYVMGPGSIDVTPEIFDCLSRALEDALYDIGAYDTFYAGMID